MRIWILAFTAMLLAGCSTWPQNPHQFRQHVNQNLFKKRLIDTAVVSRPFASVAATLHKQTNACLNRVVRLRAMTSHTGSEGSNMPLVGGDSYEGTATYKSTFTRHGNHAEASVQRLVVGSGELELGNVPKDGAYRLVVDIDALSAHRTKVVTYRLFANRSDVAMAKAYINWAKGESLRCPVLEE